MQKLFNLICLPAVALLVAFGNASASDPLIGEVRWVAFDFAPAGWATCDGQLLQVSEYSDLHDVIGNTYGGNGSTNFALPELRGRLLLAAGAGPGLTNRTLGSRSGFETVTLGPINLPNHNHDLKPGETGIDIKPNDRAVASAGRMQIFATPSSLRSMDNAAIASIGGNQAHNNIQPYVTANCIIALQGTIPVSN